MFLPNLSLYWTDMQQIFSDLYLAGREVFSRAQYVVLAVVGAVVFALVSIWLINYDFLRYIVLYSPLSTLARLETFFAINDLIAIRLMPVDLVLITILAVLFGIQISLVIYQVRHRVDQLREAGLGWVGVVVGILGVGCLSCGSVILAAIFGVGASTAFLALLPFGGKEFALVGIISLVISIIFIGRKIVQPVVCEI